MRKTSQWKIQGMHCIDCVNPVAAALQQVPGVVQVTVHYLKKQATIVTVDAVAPAAVERAVREAGYTAIFAE